MAFSHPLSKVVHDVFQDSREAWNFDLYDQMTRLWEPFRGSEIVLEVQRTDLKLLWSLEKSSVLAPLWHSNTDKIGKLKYMIKLESDIWSNSNMWSKLLPIYGQS